MTSSGCHSVKLLSTTVGYSLAAMVTDLCRHIIYDWRDVWPCFSRMIREMLAKILSIEKFDFLISIIHSQII